MSVEPVNPPGLGPTPGYANGMLGSEGGRVLFVAGQIGLTPGEGQRIANLRFQGAPVREDQSFTLALTSYRLRGGGGYMEAIGWKGEPELVTAEPHRNLFLDRVLASPTLNVAPDHNWRTLPYLDRERVLQLNGR